MNIPAGVYIIDFPKDHEFPCPNYSPGSPPQNALDDALTISQIQDLHDAAEPMIERAVKTRLDYRLTYENLFAAFAKANRSAVSGLCLDSKAFKKIIQARERALNTGVYCGGWHTALP